MFDQYLARRYQTWNRPAPDANLIKDNTAIVGIGATEFSKNSGRSELQMASEAIIAAVEDAGLKIEDIDGLVKFSIDYTIVEFAEQLDTSNSTFHLQNVKMWHKILTHGIAPKEFLRELSTYVDQDFF